MGVRRYRGARRAGLLALLALAALAAGSGASERASERAAMLDEVDRMVRLTHRETGVRALSPAVRASLLAVPRHAFVPERRRALAYENRPLPIGHGQTISQPYIVALMTELLDVDADDVVLELGTGSGYQAAVLAEIVRAVHSIEIVEPLGRAAAARLATLGYDDVQVRIGDGYFGWPEHGPYDAIIVTAAGEHVPPPLVAQLEPGGRLVIPVGSPYSVQNLLLVEKDPAGDVSVRRILPVRFVPLTRM